MNPEILLTLLQAVMLIVVLLGAIRSAGAEKKSLPIVLFAFAVASVLLSDLYWLTYDILRPGTQMPFAANVIGEWAMFLLLGAVLTSTKPICFQSAKKELLCAAFFAAASAALWIAWSGKWVDDILTGLSYGYFLCALVSRAREEDAFPASLWRFLCAACAVLLLAQAMTFFVPEPFGKALNLFCYALLFAGAAGFLVMAGLSFRNEGEPARCVCRVFAAFAWVVTVMYMSSGGFYIAAMVLSTLCFPLMLLALKKEVDAV